MKKTKRKKGYYWVYGFSWSKNKSWFIARWDGNYFWTDGDDYEEDSFKKIDEDIIVNKNIKTKLNKVFF